MQIVSPEAALVLAESSVSTLNDFPLGTYAALFGTVTFFGLGFYAWKWLVKKLTNLKVLKPIKKWASRIGDQLDKEKARHQRIEKFLAGWQNAANTLTEFSTEYRNPDAIYNAFEDVTSREAREYKKRLITVIEEFRRSGALILETTQYAVGILKTENQKVDQFFFNLNDGSTPKNTAVKAETQTKSGNNWYSATSPEAQAKADVHIYEPNQRFFVYTFTGGVNPQGGRETRCQTVTGDWLNKKIKDEGWRLGENFAVLPI